MGCADACSRFSITRLPLPLQLCARLWSLHLDDVGCQCVQVLRLGNVVPDFSAQTTQGDMPSFHEWIDGSWAILFSHPADFTVRSLLFNA